MAKIVHFHQTGAPEVLKIEEGPSREPGKGEAKLRVNGASRGTGSNSPFVRIVLLQPLKLRHGQYLPLRQ